MKIIKARYDLIFFFFFPFCIITTLLYFFQFNQFVHISGVGWFFTLFLFVFIFFPKASIKLNDVVLTKKHTLFWIIKLFLSQLLFAILIWCFVKILCIDLETGNYYVHFNIIKFSFSSGILPWSITILTALTLGYFTYHKKKPGLLSSAFEPLFNNSHQDSIGVAVDSYMRFIPFCNMIFIFTMITLSVILLLQNQLHFSLAVGLQMKVVLIGSTLLFLISQPHWIKFLHRLMYHNIPLIFILLGFTFLLGLIYPLLNRLSEFFIAINPSLEVSPFIGAMSNQGYISIIITFLWMGFGAMNGAYIAYVSQGRTLRQIILCSFIPYLFVLVLILLLERIYLLPSFWFLPFLGMMVAGIILISIMLKKQNFTYFLRATLPTEVPIKKRSNFRFLKIVPLAIVSLLCAYFGMNARVWSYLIVLGYLPPIVLLMISYVGFAPSLAKRERAG